MTDRQAVVLGLSVTGASIAWGIAWGIAVAITVYAALGAWERRRR